MAAVNAQTSQTGSFTEATNVATLGSISIMAGSILAQLEFRDYHELMNPGQMFILGGVLLLLASGLQFIANSIYVAGTKNWKWLPINCALRWDKKLTKTSHILFLVGLLVYFIAGLMTILFFWGILPA